ncbi:putative cation efflux family protein [Eutypa lata UCREL1]|uniref:Putative cation efflux family protein n=1 Tax=Eutypa lata (strain UCR-EL1) TaxID=1287681 RepID=M7TCP8_EUTLA|nr:putative cation efflux family protein [Eutypa lata UCREL1]
MRLIGNSNPKYNWARHWKTEEELHTMTKPLREYYERTNYLVQQYLYIDRLLDSSLPHDLLNEYNDLPRSSFRGVEVPDTISEEPGNSLVASFRDSAVATAEASPAAIPTPEFGSLDDDTAADDAQARPLSSSAAAKKVKRTPKAIYRPTETTPLFNNEDVEEDEYWGNNPKPEIPWLEEDDDLDSGDSIVALAIQVNFAANVILLAGKIAVVAAVPSMSVLASLVDAVLDFLSTVIVWTTTWLISRQDQYEYPVGRRRLEPLGVLVFSVIMITSFTQVALESAQKLASSDNELIELGIPAISIMVSTVVIKGLCWIWCRLVKNSSVQALAADAMTDVIFNIGSIFFPIVGFYAKIWWMDALGGLLLSVVVIFNWSQTSLEHIKNLSGFSATADERNILLYLTMRFAKTIRQIQGLQAYHAGDKLIVECDIVLDASTTLRDSHDLSESLSYVLESVPVVDRAFVHTDYATYNLPTHMQQ